MNATQPTKISAIARVMGMTVVALGLMLGALAVSQPAEAGSGFGGYGVKTHHGKGFAQPFFFHRGFHGKPAFKPGRHGHHGKKAFVKKGRHGHFGKKVIVKKRHGRGHGHFKRGFVKKRFGHGPRQEVLLLQRVKKDSLNSYRETKKAGPILGSGLSFDLSGFTGSASPRCGRAPGP